MQTFKSLLVPIIIQVFLLISFALYWIYLGSINKITEVVIFVAPLFILLSLIIYIASRHKHLARERLISGEEEQVISLNQYDELKHDLATYGCAIAILIVAKIFSDKVDSADVLQAIVALLFMYLVKRIYFSKVR